MKKVLFISTLFIFYSCGKNDYSIKQKNQGNHMEATILLASGTTITINETGENVTLTKGVGSFFAFVTNNQSQQVSVNTADNDYNGLVECTGNYYPNYASTPQITYENNNYAIPGDTIIYTNISGNYREGSFHLTCINPPADTVKMMGSFKGEFEY
ncbi:MAG: hypothetical protein ABI402_05345 [Ferruginibacter sp.]